MERTYMEGRNTFQILTVKPTTKRPLLRLRWEDNVTMDLKEHVGNMVDST